MKRGKNREDEMTAIAKRVTGTPAASVQEMALRIAKEAPTLADLNANQLEQIARMVMTQRLTQELNTAATLAGIDYHAEKETFLNNAGNTDSSTPGAAIAPPLPGLKPMRRGRTFPPWN
jgi:hypothetical protein